MISERPLFLPRNFQTAIIKDIQNGVKRIAISVARRGGKDYVGLASADIQALQKEGSNIGYLGLSLKSLKKILMSNNQDGNTMYKDVIDVKNTMIKTRGGDYLHKEVGAFKYNNGSLIYLLGTDQNMELGTSMDMLVITESARIPFSAWEFLVPSIRGNKGVIIQISTPYYGSEFNDLLDGEHEYSSEYKVYKIPADELLNADGTRVYTDEDLEEIEREMDNASFRQDYMVDTKAINGISIMGYSLQKATISELPKVEDELINEANGLRLTCVFDLGQEDSTAMTMMLESSMTPPTLVGQMTQNKTSLSTFAEYIVKYARENRIPPHCVDIVLPFDGDHDLQGYHGKINRYQEFKSNMARYNVHLLGRGDKMRGVQVTRQVLETGKLHLAGYRNIHGEMELTYEAEQLKKVVSSVDYKVEKSTGKIQYVIDKRSGVYGDHPLDSLRYLVMWKFKYLFTGDYSDIKAVKPSTRDKYPYEQNLDKFNDMVSIGNIGNIQPEY